MFLFRLHSFATIEFFSDLALTREPFDLFLGKLYFLFSRLSYTSFASMPNLQTEDYNYTWNLQLSGTDNLPVSSEHSISSQSFTARGSSSGQSLDITKQDFTSQVSPGNAPTYGPTTTYQSQKSSFQPSSGTPSTYNAYSANSQSSQSTFQTASASANTNSYSATATVSQANYNSSTSFPQSNASTFSQASPSASSSATSGYNQPTTSSQVTIVSVASCITNLKISYLLLLNAW